MDLRAYAGLQEGERMLGCVRQSWLCAVPFFVLGLAVFFAVSYRLFSLLAMGTLGSVMIAFGYAIALWLCIAAYSCWAGTMLVVTDERVIFLQMGVWFSTLRQEIAYADMEDVSHERSHPVDIFFRLGSLHCVDLDREVSMHARHLPSSFSVFGLIQETREHTLF